MKLLKSLLFLLIILGNCTASYNAYANNDPIKTNQANANILLIQNADEAVLKPSTQQTGSYKLILKGVKPYVSYFTDKPDRVTGLMTIKKFLQEWQIKGKNNLLQDAPNVGISGTELHSIFNEKDVNVVMMLTNPEYKPEENILIYKASLLPGQKNQMGHQELKLHNVALFFDDLTVCWSCGGGGF